MRVDVRLYAAFAAKEFGGNIAGIVYDEVGLSPAQMQGIATDFEAPTTGFVRRLYRAKLFR
jgi:predicted PhzF superfamily epimerase YddE/YHI9